MENCKKKVLIVHNYYRIPGGEDTVVDNEKRMLEEHGHEVVLYSRKNEDIKDNSPIKKLYLFLAFVFNIKTYRDIKKIIVKEKINILHVHNTLALISPSVYYAGIHCKIPVVQTVHNFRLLCPGATFYRKGKICEECLEKGLYCAVKNGCYRDSKLQSLACVLSMKIHRFLGIYRKINYICLTEFNKEKLMQINQNVKKKTFIDPKKVFIKPNCTYEKIQISKKISRNPQQIVYVGRLDELKGIKILLEAWKIMGTEAPDLLICGTGPLKRWCERYISDNHLLKVQMKGLLPNDEVKKIIAQSKALILPTQWYEGFPMTIVEAFSVGVPVIGSDIGNVGILIKEGTNGWKFQHSSPEALASAVQKCMKEQIKKLDYKDTEIVSSELNYRALLEIYQKIETNNNA